MLQSKSVKIAALVLAVIVALTLIIVLSTTVFANAATVKVGSRGTVVKTIQTKLKRWGYYTGSVYRRRYRRQCHGKGYGRNVKRLYYVFVQQQYNRKRSKQQRLVPALLLYLRRSPRRKLHGQGSCCGGNTQPRQEFVFPQQHFGRNLPKRCVYLRVRRTNQPRH